MRWTVVLISILLGSGVGLAQSVISVRSGLINYSEGAVFIDNQIVAQRPGKYPTLHDGSDLLTQDGRAEILLTPEAYLRVGNNSAVRMVSGSFADTSIQVLSGSVIFDSGNAAPGAPITLLAGDARIRIEKPSRLRIDLEPPQLRVMKGEAIVGRAGDTTKVGADQIFGLAGTSIVRRMSDGADDSLDLWSQQRNRLIYLSLANDRNILDPGTADTGLADAGAGAWLGYIPSAGILPLTGSYVVAGIPVYGYGYGYGYYPSWSTLVFYGPVYRQYPAIYPGGLRNSGLGVVRGVSGGIGYRPVPGFRPLPPSSGGLGTLAPRPVGGIRIGSPPGGGIAMPRPVAPRLPVRR